MEVFSRQRKENEMNKSEERMERKFSIFDLLWNILEKWRLMLVCMLVFAVVLVTYGVVSNQSIERQNQQLLSSQVEEKEIAEEELLLEERELVEVYWNLYQQYVQQKDYNENAVLMNLDAANLHRTKVQFYIDRKEMNEQKGRTETNENFVRTVKGFLRNTLESQELVHEVEEIIGTEGGLNYQEECVSPDVICNKVTEESANVFSFAVVAPTKEQSEAIAQKAVEIIEREAGKLQEQLGEFEISFVSCEYSAGEEMTVLNYQREKQNILCGSKNTLTSLSDRFTKVQVDYLYQLSDGAVELKSKIQETETGTAGDEPVLKSTVSPVLYGIAGLFVGMLLAGFLTAIGYLNDKKMRFYSANGESTGMRVIQTVIDESSMSRNVIDHFLFRLRYRNLHLFTGEEALNFAIADIKTTMKKKKLGRLYLSLYDLNKQKKLAEKIKKSLENSDIQVDFGNSILYDAQAMEKLAEKDAIVFLEECNQTLLAEIEKEKTLCEEKEIQMLGMIVGLSGNK